MWTLDSLKLELHTVVSHRVGAEPFLQPYDVCFKGRLTWLRFYSCPERGCGAAAAVAIFRAGCQPCGSHMLEMAVGKQEPGARELPGAAHARLQPKRTTYTLHIEG